MGESAMTSKNKAWNNVYPNLSSEWLLTTIEVVLAVNHHKKFLYEAVYHTYAKASNMWKRDTSPNSLLFV